MAAKEKESKALPEGQAENPKKPSKIKRIVILLAILLMTLSGAGAGAYWWFYLRTPSSSAAAAHEAAPAKAGEKGAPGASGGHDKAAPGTPGGSLSWYSPRISSRSGKQTPAAPTSMTTAFPEGSAASSISV